MLHHCRRSLFILALSVILIALVLESLAPLAFTQAQDDDPPPPLVELNEDVIKRATVFIMQTYQNKNVPVISCIGSGTLVSADGLILTNAHTVLSSDICRSDRLIIAITVRLDEPPVPTYTAEIVEASRGLDLAVLRINGYLDGRAIEPGTLQLPFVELGDSLTVRLDDTITVVGYPGFGNEPVALTRGTIGGFTAEARTGDRAWIRTSATIPGTMTGGGAYNREGKLIGVPTIAPALTGGAAVDCRIIQDSNLDGRADRGDTCVPVGGFISALRPSRLARGLVRAATLGIRQGPGLTGTALAAMSGAPTFDRLFFATRINEAGVPANVVGSVPAGTSSLYLFFDYHNMVDGTVYELRVTVDDVPDPIYSLPPVPWNGGRRGLWYIGSLGTPWRNGLYDFRLFIEGREVASRRITIGGGPRDDPAFSDIVFGVMEQSGSLAGTSYVLPEGAAIQARFAYRHMRPGLPWTYIWYYEGQELARDTAGWDRDEQGTHLITAQADFLPGQYRLELYLENTLSATADFVIAGGAVVTDTLIFSDFQFATGISEGAPRGTVRADFPARIESLYVFFNWRLLAPGTPWTRRWTVDGDILFEVTEPWNATTEGQSYYLSLSSLEALPDGTYGLEIIIANITLARVSAKVGLGQLPVGAFASAAGVQMTGRITDADSGQGIPGAMFIVLRAEYSTGDFMWSDTQVLGVSLADSSGRFQIPALLPRGTADSPLYYSVLVRAEGYLPVQADRILVIEDTPSPVELNVALSRN